MTEYASGILKLAGRGEGLLLDPERAFRPAGDDVCAPARLVREHGLVEGAIVTGPVQIGKRGPELAAVTTICGLAPEQYRGRTPFDRLIAVSPSERFRLAAGGEISMRIVDLIAPIGKGTRGLIVSPPKAGKTTLLGSIARGVRASDPETRIIMLLIDERPEEVTYFRRSVDAEVFASSSDQPIREHVALIELMLAHIRLELECGRDVVVLVDSLTRLVRAFNLRGASGRDRSRSLSGGLEAGAVEVPRRFFGLARAVEGGGSVTIVATALVDTGSRMDQVIYEEFKGTGNSELVLDRTLAEAAIYPAINLLASSTRNEDRLYDGDDVQRLVRLRRALAKRSPRAALTGLLELLDRYPTNAELLQAIPLTYT